jgi:hypothetical protein
LKIQLILKMSNYCSVFCLCVAAVSCVLSVAFMGIAVSTDNWQHVSGKLVVFVDDVVVVSDVDDVNEAVVVDDVLVFNVHGYRSFYRQYV